MGGEALGPVKALCPSIGECQDQEWEGGNNHDVSHTEEGDNFGHVIDCSLINGCPFWSTYNNFGVLKELWASTEQVLEYTFDTQTGNLLKIEDTAMGRTIDNFTYDKLNRLSNSLSYDYYNFNDGMSMSVDYLITEIGRAHV